MNGEPIIGASVVEKGVATNGTVTDFEGNYTLTISSDELQISYIGYLPQVVKVHSGTSFYNVTLKEDTKTLDEVVVIGYGTQKKVNLTGSVASVSSSEIKDRVQTNVLSAVQGTVPGVTVISRPGSTPSINFRGRGNLGTSEPLYVIDGAIADAAFFQSLNPNSIESISFLKDASSSAIYGSRAAYGVVLVTTKNGEKGKMNVSYSGLVGMKTPTYLPKTVDSWEYASMLNEGMYNRNAANGKYQAYSQEEIDKFRNGTDLDYYPNTNWADLVLDKHVLTTQHSVSFSGGSDKVRYFMNLGYMYDDKPNFMSGQDKTRYTLDTNIASDITKWFTVKGSIKYIRNVSDTEHGQPWMGNFLLVPSIMVAQQSNGEWGSIAGGKQATQSFITGNPLRALSNKNWSKSKTEETMYDLGFDIKPVKGLVISGQGVFRGQEYKGKSYTALQDEVKTFETGTPIGGTGTYTNSMSMNWSSVTRMLYTGTIKYDWSNSIHNITALAGTSYEHYKYEALSAGRKNFPSDALEDLNGGSNAGKDLSNGGGMTEYKILSYFGRINYDYAHKYYASLSYRHDGSSRFAKENRWGNFWSFGAGWRISEEAFMKDVKWVNNLKLRASYGETGNDNILDSDGDPDYYPYQTLYGLGYKNGSEAGAYFTVIANPSLKWETQISTDIALEFGLFDRLTGTIEYFKKDSKDLLFDVSQPASVGVTSIIQNIGKVTNSGVEIELDYNAFKNKDWSVSVGANATFVKNKIKNLPATMKENGYISGSKKWLEGKSIYEFWLRQWHGVDPQTGDGLYVADVSKYNQGNIGTGDGNITQSQFDEYKKTVVTIDGKELTNSYTYAKYDFSGSSIPDVYGGFNVRVSYKNFDLAAVFSYQLGGQILDTNYATMMSMTEFGYAQSPDLLKAWKQAGDITEVPRIDNSAAHTTNIGQSYSTRWLTSSDYLNLRSVTIGYQLPKTWLSKVMLKSARLNLTAENLFMLKARQGLNPMANYSGVTYNEYMPSRNITLGLNVSF